MATKTTKEDYVLGCPGGIAFGGRYGSTDRTPQLFTITLMNRIRALPKFWWLGRCRIIVMSVVR
ncbi:MAG TPA: hypothetical protein VN784_14415 [Candidatus Limnocylindrales bacterium]|nr:hypothetical protein [Candidatus Limnocylindrales bacterium]